jgi:hypothetical protein
MARTNVRKLLAEQLVLRPHERRLPLVLVAGGEVAVPEQRQLLLQRVGPVGHPPEPPGDGGADRLLVGLPELHAKFHLLLLGLAGGLADDLLVVGVVPVDAGQVGLVGALLLGPDVLEVHQPVDRLGRPQLQHLADLVRCPAEPRPVQQVGGLDRVERVGIGRSVRLQQRVAGLGVHKLWPSMVAAAKTRERGFGRRPPSLH